jgi:thiamine biosynthesis lipoprotein ApbE
LAEIDREAKIVSSYDPSSEFSIWFRTCGQPLHVSREFYETLSLWDQWRQRTNGALDAAAAAVIRVWKTAASEDREPSQSELSAAVAEVQKVHWRLDPVQRTATHMDRVPLELNSFTKSYIIGKAADAALKASKVSAVVVNIGGDLVVRGAWTEPVDIADPQADAENSPPMARLAIHDQAIATSGNYRRGVEIQGRHYSHIVDPRTGLPCDEVVSSTVVARDPVDAGAMATAFSVLSPNDSRRLATSIPGVEFLLAMSDGEQVRSQGWDALAGKPLQVAVARPQSGKTDAWDPSCELVITVELAQFGAQVRRPYMAVWIEDRDKFPVRTLALWYNKDRFLPELRAWYRGSRLRSMVGGPDIAHSISSATRPAGKYTLKWDGKDDAGKPVKAGKYTVFIEASREHGGYAVLHQEMDFSGVPQTIPLKGSSEVAAASLEYRKIKTP